MLEMQGTNASPTQPAIALSFLCIVIEIAKIMWETEISEKHVYIDPINFYDNTFKYLNIDRIGGVLSFLRRNLRNDLIASLGPDHPSITQPDIPEPQQQSEFSDICKVYSTKSLESELLVIWWKDHLSLSPCPLILVYSRFGFW